MGRVELKKHKGLEAWLPDTTPIYYCIEDNEITEGFWSKGTLFLGNLEDTYVEHLEYQLIRIATELELAKIK